MIQRFLLLALVLFASTTTVLAQNNVPQGINYQCIVRNNQTGDPISNQTVTLLFAIRNGSPTGSVDYQEKHISATNDFGLANLVVGRGQPQINTFAAINWAAGSKYLTVLLETSPNVFDEIGTSELLSVPFALYAQNGGGGGSGDNWGSQTAFTNNGLSGNGLANNPIGLAQQGAQNGQVLKWNGTSWAPADDIQGTGTGGGTVTQVNTGVGLQGGPITTNGTISLTNTGVQAGIHGSATEIPVITVDAQGRITNIEKVIVQPGAVGLNSGNGINVVTNGFNNFTIENTGDLNGNDDVLTNTQHDGDVSGIYNNLQLKANVVTANELANGAVTAQKLSDMGANTGQVLKWNGTAWAPAADEAGNINLNNGAGISITGAAPNFTITNTGDTNPNDDLTTASQANGDVTGPFNNLQIKADAVTSAEIADDAVGSTEILDGSVGSAELAANAVTAIKMADGAVLTVKIANDAVTSAKIADGTISTADVADQAITGNKIDDMNAANGQVLKWNGTTWAPAADNTGNFNVLGGIGISVTPSNNTFVVNNDGDINPADDLTDATQFNGDVTGPYNSIQIRPGAVVNQDMAANSIGTANLINGAVTAAKLNNMNALNGQVLQFNNGAWAPANLAPLGDNWGGQTVVSNNTLSGNGTAGNPLGIAQQGAVDGQLLRWTGATWAPGTLQVGTALVGNGTAANPLNIAQQGAVNGQVLRWNGTAWAPATPAPGDNWGAQTAAVSNRLSGNGTAGSPLDLAQNGAVNGQIMQWNGANWAPANPPAGDNWGSQTVQTAGSELSGNGTNATPIKLAQQGATNGQVLQWNGANWIPANQAAADNWGTQTTVVTARLIGNGTAGNGLDLAPQGAAAGEVLKWNGAAWTPAPDNSGGAGDVYNEGIGIDITGTAPNFVINNSGDLSTTNELQTLSIAGNQLSISSGNTVNLPAAPTYSAGAGIDITGTVITNTGDADANPTNELQNLTIAGTTLSISNGNSVTLPTGTTYNAGAGIDITGNTISNTGDADANATNELQNLSIAGNVLSISNGNSVNLPAAPTYTGGVGIDITGTVVNNTGDLDPTNEIQSLSLTGSVLEISGGNNVDLGPLLNTAGDDWNNNGDHIFNANVGNVGIGINLPAARLHVVGNGESVRLQGNTPSIAFAGAAAPGFLRMTNQSFHMATTDATNIHIQPNGINAIVANGTTGHVGIGEPNLGAAALRVLQKAGGIALQNNNNGNGWEFSASALNGNLELYNNAFGGGLPVGTFLPNGQYLAISDRRLKTDVSILSSGILNKVMALQPMQYRYVAEKSDAQQSIGFMAQDLQTVFPELVGKFIDRETNKEYLNVNYNGISVLAIKAIQEQQVEIETLKKENEALKAQFQSLEARLLQLEKK